MTLNFTLEKHSGFIPKNDAVRISKRAVGGRLSKVAGDVPIILYADWEECQQ